MLDGEVLDGVPALIRSRTWLPATEDRVFLIWLALQGDNLARALLERLEEDRLSGDHEDDLLVTWRWLSESGSSTSNAPRRLRAVIKYLEEFPAQNSWDNTVPTCGYWCLHAVIERGFTKYSESLLVAATRGALGRDFDRRFDAAELLVADLISDNPIFPFVFSAVVEPQDSSDPLLNLPDSLNLDSCKLVVALYDRIRRGHQSPSDNDYYNKFVDAVRSRRGAQFFSAVRALIQRDWHGGAVLDLFGEVLQDADVLGSQVSSLLTRPTATGVQLSEAAREIVQSLDEVFKRRDFQLAWMDYLLRTRQFDRLADAVKDCRSVMQGDVDFALVEANMAAAQNRFEEALALLHRERPRAADARTATKLAKAQVSFLFAAGRAADAGGLLRNMLINEQYSLSVEDRAHTVLNLGKALLTAGDVTGAAEQHEVLRAQGDGTLAARLALAIARLLCERKVDAKSFGVGELDHWLDYIAREGDSGMRARALILQATALAADGSEEESRLTLFKAKALDPVAAADELQQNGSTGEIDESGNRSQ